MKLIKLIILSHLMTIAICLADSPKAPPPLTDGQLYAEISKALKGDKQAAFDVWKHYSLAVFDKHSANAWLSIACDLGHSGAQYNRALLLFIDNPESAEGNRLMRLSAEAGCPPAVNYLRRKLQKNIK